MTRKKVTVEEIAARVETLEHVLRGTGGSTGVRPLKPGEVLKVDLQAFHEAFWQNESAGESRVRFFVGLVAAVFSGLVALFATLGESAEKHAVLTSGPFRGIAVGAGFFLLALGVLTYFRMVRRNCVTEEYKAATHYIRTHWSDETFAERYDPLPLKDDKRFKPRTGGLAHLVSAINALLFSGVAALLLGVRESRLWLVGVVILAILAFVLQASVADKRRDGFKTALRQRFEAGAGSTKA